MTAMTRLEEIALAGYREHWKATKGPDAPEPDQVTLNYWKNISRVIMREASRECDRAEG